MDELQEIAIDELRKTPAGQMIKRAMDTVTAIQKNLFALAASEDSAQLNLLKIGSVFQIFFIDTLASKKDPKKLQREEWLELANKVSKYAILEDDQSYSEFVFNLYADYIDLSVNSISAVVPETTFDSIKNIASDLRCNSAKLRNGTLSEIDYVDNCLWLSLEAMLKLLSASLSCLVGKEYSLLAQAVSQLAFEYGRYSLYAREQAILQEYVDNQYMLDDQLELQYAEFIADIKHQSELFMGFVNEAFSPGIHDALLSSVALGRAAGVKEEELLKTIDEIDSFFID